MKLLRQLAKLEGAAAAAALEAEAPEMRVGLCYSSDHVHVDPADLARGEAIALDVWIDDVVGVDGLMPTPQVHIVERITADPADLGRVYDRHGDRVGRLVSIEGDLLSWRWLLDVPLEALAAPEDAAEPAAG